MGKKNIAKMKRSNAELSRFIEFRLGDKDFAILLSMVREVISIPDIVPILRSPPHLLGIINLRGQMITVFDLRKKLQLGPRNNKEEAVVIIDIGGTNVGVVVDAVNKVLTFTFLEVREMPVDENQLNSHFIIGIYKKEYSMTFILDIAKILDSKDMQAIKDSKNSKKAA